MKLVERFVEIGGWPISRKSALIIFLTLPAHLGACGIAHWGFSRAQIVNQIPLTWVMLGGVLAIVIPLIYSLIMIRLRKDAPSTAYLFIVLYGL